MWCMHSIFSVKSVFLGSTTSTCGNMLWSSAGGFPHITCRELCNILQELSSDVFKRHRYSKRNSVRLYPEGGLRFELVDLREIIDYMVGSITPLLVGPVIKLNFR